MSFDKAANNAADAAVATDDWRADIEACGYFPEFVIDSLTLALAQEPVLGHLVHQEATFMTEEIRRHVTVLVLTQTRLIALHTDDGVDEAQAEEQAITTTESVPLRSIKTVSLSRVVNKPELFAPEQPQIVETWLALSWGAMSRVDLEPATCGDPTCEADHGYSGALTGDDMTIRMSPAADGAANVAKLVAFASTLQLAVAR